MLSGLAVVCVLSLAAGCAPLERRTDLTPPGTESAWSDAPAWHDQPGLLVPPGYKRPGDGFELERQRRRLAQRHREFQDSQRREQRPPASPAAVTGRGTSNWPRATGQPARPFPAAPGRPNADSPVPSTQPTSSP